MYNEEKLINLQRDRMERVRKIVKLKWDLENKEEAIDVIKAKTISASYQNALLTNEGQRKAWVVLEMNTETKAESKYYELLKQELLAIKEDLAVKEMESKEKDEIIRFMLFVQEPKSM